MILQGQLLIVLKNNHPSLSKIITELNNYNNYGNLKTLNRLIFIDKSEGKKSQHFKKKGSCHLNFNIFFLF